jgi:predicted transcriptional regulator
MTWAATNVQMDMLRAIQNDDRDHINRKRAGETLRSLLNHGLIAQAAGGSGWQLTAAGEKLLRDALSR